MTCIVWIRQDLRLDDHPALRAACESGVPVIPVYIYSEDSYDTLWRRGAASRWWLHYALEDLSAQLAEAGSRLIIGAGRASELLGNLCKKHKVDKLFFNERYEAFSMEEEDEVQRLLSSQGVACYQLPGSLLYNPKTLKNQQGNPYQVFTPFWKAALASDKAIELKEKPRLIAAPRSWPDSLAIEDLKLLPKIRWDEEIRQTWSVSRIGAKKRFEDFTKSALKTYSESRDVPEIDGTSRLSPYLHFGQISPRRIRKWIESKSLGTAKSREHFVREIGWRDFGYHLMTHFPHTADKPLRPEFEKFPWKTDPAGLRAWQKGETGYPIVDAGMRQLWKTGWMHNRVRMIVASFLVKDLQISWIEGAKWFWDTLVDADLSSNTLGWQWAGGCGADAAPYFRIFNPLLQSQKFDPEGNYIRRWVPELSNLHAKHIHAPEKAPPSLLNSAGVKLDSTYPRPIVDHSQARQLALKAYDEIKKNHG